MVSRQRQEVVTLPLLNFEDKEAQRLVGDTLS